MLTLGRRDCVLGAKANADTKESPDGGEMVKTIGISLTNIMLEANELNALLCEPHAYDVLFNTNASSVEPYLKSLKTMELKDPCEHALVKLEYGLESKQIIFSDCKLSKIKLELLSGGDVSMSCKVLAVPALDDSLADLIDKLGESAYCEIRANPPSAQQDLPLSKFGEGETLKREPAKPKRRPHPAIN